MVWNAWWELTDSNGGYYNSCNAATQLQKKKISSRDRWISGEYGAVKENRKGFIVDLLMIVIASQMATFSSMRAAGTSQGGRHVRHVSKAAPLTFSFSLGSSDDAVSTHRCRWSSPIKPSVGLGNWTDGTTAEGTGGTDPANVPPSRTAHPEHVPVVTWPRSISAGDTIIVWMVLYCLPLLTQKKDMWHYSVHCLHPWTGYQ